MAAQQEKFIVPSSPVSLAGDLLARVSAITFYTPDYCEYTCTWWADNERRSGVFDPEDIAPTKNTMFFTMDLVEDPTE